MAVNQTGRSLRRSFTQSSSSRDIDIIAISVIPLATIARRTQLRESTIDFNHLSRDSYKFALVNVSTVMDITRLGCGENYEFLRDYRSRWTSRRISAATLAGSVRAVSLRFRTNDVLCKRLKHMDLHRRASTCICMAWTYVKRPREVRVARRERRRCRYVTRV